LEGHTGRLVERTTYSLVSFGLWLLLRQSHQCNELVQVERLGFELSDAEMCFILTGAAFNLLVTEVDKMNLQRIEQHFSKTIPEVLN